MLKRKWKCVLSGLFLCVLLVVGAVWYLARSPSLDANGELKLVSLTNAVSGPIATLEGVDAEPWHLRKTFLTRMEMDCPIEVYRDRQWTELVQREGQVMITASLLRGEVPIKGITLEVQVPVCEKWRIKVWRSELRQFQTK